MNVWKKRLIMFCIGLAMGSSGIQFYKGNFAAGIGFLVSCIYAIGWRIECGIAEIQHEDSETWENVAHTYERQLAKELERNSEKKKEESANGNG